jgi:phospholipase/carboxylesterase
VCEVNPYGFQWFSLSNRDPKVMLDGIKRAEKILNQFIDTALDELSLGDKDLALVGFSQGTMLALHTGLRRPQPMGAVVGFSGALIGADTLAKASVSKPPVCLIHGQYDDVVPFASMGSAVNALNGFGLAVEAHVRPMLGHSIDLEGINAAKAFLKKNLGA